MFRSKIIKKKTKNRQTLLRNLRKGQARKEQRCAFQTIPYPLKFILPRQMHHLCADIVLMEHNQTLVHEASLLNDFKTYKDLHVMNYLNQKTLKVLIDNKHTYQINWKYVVDSLIHSESVPIRRWSDSVRRFCERHEVVIKEFGGEEISKEKLEMLQQINSKTEKTRQNLFKNYPCAEFKSQLKNGQIQMTEIIYNEKYLKELGYSLESFSNVVLNEGIPQTIPYDGAIAKLRLDKYLTTDQDGYQTPEFESSLIMKCGYVKKVKLQIYYRVSYEKGVLGFSFIPIIVAKQKPVIYPIKAFDGVPINPEYIQIMSQKEKTSSEFLSEYYNQKLEGKFTNLDKVCKVREIKDCI